MIEAHKCRLEVEKNTNASRIGSTCDSKMEKKTNLRGEDTNNAYRAAAMSDSNK